MDPKETARRKFEEAIKDKKGKEEKAEAVVWAAVVINSGMGAVPLGINIWTFLGVVSVMVVFLGSNYDHHVSHEGAGKIIKHIFFSVGTTWMAFTFGLKFFAEVMKGVGIITMGGATVAGMALDAVLCGAVTYAVGFTTKDYFKKNKKMSKTEIKSSFEDYFKEGKSKVKSRTK